MVTSLMGVVEFCFYFILCPVWQEARASGHTSLSLNLIMEPDSSLRSLLGFLQRSAKTFTAGNREEF
jgi:hypothetical protein